ncbi:unnamed protein product [Blepharisma stoltei]|uniref:Uncharacterized protein n=1 Tax=Blepharisma stoltei TaxID=1481888 RepID=A0AAU9IXM9_9CILI|nr:unnamed protein product [Blepharisma stoltei]
MNPFLQENEFPFDKDIIDMSTEIFRDNLSHSLNQGLKFTHQAKKNKKTIENETLSGIEPADKAFQFKKIIKELFVWIHKSKAVSITDEQFWEWARSINPESLNKEKELKITCTDFFERIVSSPQFRTIIRAWIKDYEKTLDDGEENLKTKILLEYIKKRIREAPQGQSKLKKRCVGLQVTQKTKESKIQTENEEYEKTVDELNNELEVKSTILTIMKKNFRDQEKIIEGLKEKIESVAGKCYESDS